MIKDWTKEDANVMLKHIEDLRAATRGTDHDSALDGKLNDLETFVIIAREKLPD